MKTLKFSTQWTSPSNIALVKYWGKHGNQLPMNPSISFTLKHSVTTMSIDVYPGTGELSFFFEGQLNEKFQEKIKKFLSSQEDQFPWLRFHELIIHSTNTFPHSSGIASSASSMSALCLNLLSVDEEMKNEKRSGQSFLVEASRLSRLASGSASRSVYPVMAAWGETSLLANSSDEWAVSFDDLHDTFKTYCDSILIVDAKEKSVSSRAGHSLMENHLFKNERFAVAKENMNELVSVLKNGNMERFIEIVEEEALMLHALMMTSRPSYILLKPESLAVIEKIKAFRKEHSLPVCFTIDAGPNIHLLYPKAVASTVRAWIEEELSPYLDGQKVIHDEVGSGPERLK